MHDIYILILEDDEIHAWNLELSHSIYIVAVIPNLSHFESFSCP